MIAVSGVRNSWLIVDRKPALGLIQPLQLGIRLLLRGQGGLDRQLGLFELGDIPQIDEVAGDRADPPVDRRP